jgi:hypothetical protein
MVIEIRAPIDVGVMIIRGVLEHGRSHAALGTFAVGPVRLRFVQTPSGFFTRLPGERCWRLDPEGIGDGAPFIAMRGSRFLAPRPIGGLVRLELNEWDPDARALADRVQDRSRVGPDRVHHRRRGGRHGAHPRDGAQDPGPEAAVS